METVTITKKEYNALAFAKSLPVKKDVQKNKYSWDVAFGVLKNTFGKGNSANYINKLRKSWR